MIDLVHRRLTLEEAIAAFTEESAPILREHNKHRYFMPDRDSSKSRHSSKGRGRQRQKNTKRF